MAGSDSTTIEALRRGDESAIAAAFAEHGRMVYNACFRALGEAHAAEDAAQATFLVLLRKAAGLPRGTNLGGWLHRAAMLVAREQRRVEARRRERERRAGAMVESERRGDSADWDRIRGGLDDALAALPDRERDAIVLTYLEGLPREDAARKLGLPEGTVASRLGRGLARLRDRLSRRDAPISTDALGLMMLHRACEAAVPDSILPSILASSKVLAAGAAAGGAGKAIVLAEGAVRAMFFAKMKAAAVVLAAVLFAGATGVAVKSALGEDRAPAPPEPARPTTAGEEKKDPASVNGLAAVEFGPAANGLRVALKLDRTALAKGEKWELTSVLENVSDKPIRVPAWGLMDFTGRLTEILDASGKLVEPGGGRDATARLHEGHFHTIHPGKSKDFRLSATLDENLRLTMGELQGGWMNWQLAPGAFRIRAVMNCRKKEAEVHVGGQAGSKRIEDLWMGSVSSKEVPIQVKAKGQKVSLALSASKAEYKAGEKINLKAEVRNESSELLQVNKADFVNCKGLTIAGPDGRFVPTVADPVEVAGLNRQLVDLKPGEKIVFEIADINTPGTAGMGIVRGHHFRLDLPGEYKATVTYEGTASNAVTFRVGSKEQEKF